MRPEPGSPPPVDRTYPVPEEHLSARVRALEEVLVERGLIPADAVDRIASVYEHEISPLLGAKVVGRAWADDAFRDRLLDNATDACSELGIGGLEGEHMVAVPNTPQVHNVVVCTLCSCYPWPVLGLPPNWYKYPAFRSRVVESPRRVLSEDFGLQLSAQVEVRVWDSSSEIRYFVLPERPADADDLSESELAELVTRDHLIGVAR
jgi:nitrile hydratase subunit alpha